ncbi:MAG: glutamine amidotransferase [Isosphaeraceae bacterium]
MSMSFDPVGSWFLLALFALVVTGLTVWAYAQRLRGTTGAWRWFALGLRLAAVFLCLVAALRPTVIFQEKKKQPTSLIFLLDGSKSMGIHDEIRGQSRWEFARKTLEEAQAAGRKLGNAITVKTYRFDSTLREDSPKNQGKPEGRQTALGQALIEGFQRESGTRVARMVVLSDGSNNYGISPLVAARQLRGQQVPLIAVGFGSENAGAESRDIAVRDLVAGPTVFVKNQLEIKATLLVRGFASQTLDVEMLVEGHDEPVATQRIKVTEGAELVPIRGLKYVPRTPGEKKVTLRVKVKEGELVQTNNSLSTFVTVLKGGLNVLFVQGPHSPWEQKFLMRSIASSADIQADLRIIRGSARAEKGELRDEDFTPERYDVYIFSDLPANFLTPTQHALLARSVDRGAGFIMLGGRSSFGSGGWGATEVARVLPVRISASDGQIEPEGGVKFLPNTRGLENYLLQIVPNRAESARIWNALPPLPGINRLGQLKLNATVFGQTAGARPEPIMVGTEAGRGRVLAFAGETWVWARTSDEGRAAHQKFWRQVIFWLSHKEDKGENEVKLRLDSRRISIGQKLDFGVSARDSKGNVIPNVTYETRVEKYDPGPDKFSEPVDVFTKGEESRGTFFANQATAGDFRVSVVAKVDGKEIGRDHSRFMVYEDDRELEDPAADRALLRQLAQASGGESLTPEQLSRYLSSLDGKLFTESYSQTERKIWDNWPFLLLFTTFLTLEWWVRKRHGWV